MTNSEPKWIAEDQALFIHDKSIARFGGGSGVRDAGLHESALARPENAFHYGEGDVFQLAAAYAMGIARNHPFVDGNKRTGYAAAGLFLIANGYRLLVGNVDEQIRLFENVAAGKVAQDALAAFYRAHTISNS